MENQTPEETKKTVHLAASPKMAEGGTIHKAEDRNKEPAKPKDVNMSHEKKLHSIYKAMGVKGYDDGGHVTGDVDASQLPPSPSDPSYMDTRLKPCVIKSGQWSRWHYRWSCYESGECWC